MRLFTFDLTATQMAELSGLNRNTVNRYLKGVRKRIAEYCNMSAPQNKLAEEIDEVGQCADIAILSIYEQSGTIYTCLFADGTLPKESVLSQKVDVLVYLKEGRRRWLRDTSQEHQNGRARNKIDGFQGFLKSRLEKFKGMPSQTCYLHIKESEFRFNNPKSELYKMILEIIRNNPLFSQGRE